MPDRVEEPFRTFALPDGLKLWVGFPVLFRAHGDERSHEELPSMYSLGCVVQLSTPKEVRNEGGLTAILTADFISLADAVRRAGRDGQRVLDAAKELLPVVDAQASALGVDKFDWWVSERAKFQAEIAALTAPSVGPAGPGD